MPLPIEPTGIPAIVSEAVTWLLGTMWAALVFLVSLIWKKHNREIDQMKASIGDGTPLKRFIASEEELKRDIKDLRDSMETNDERKRLAIIDVHRKIESTASELRGSIEKIDDKADKRHSDIMTVLLSMKK